ncbi:MAG: hypothetical protein ABIO81_14065, partial [Ginsengibacter sp.]
GLSMKPLLAKFGIDVHNGYTEDTLLNNKSVADALLFEKSKGNLNQTNPICQTVERINTYVQAESPERDSAYPGERLFTNYTGRNYFSCLRLVLPTGGG